MGHCPWLSRKFPTSFLSNPPRAPQETSLLFCRAFPFLLHPRDFLSCSLGNFRVAFWERSPCFHQQSFFCGSSPTSQSSEERGTLTKPQESFSFNPPKGNSEQEQHHGTTHGTDIVFAQIPSQRHREAIEKKNKEKSFIYRKVTSNKSATEQILQREKRCVKTQT